MIANSNVINICSLARLILHIIEVDFDRNTKNSFSDNIENVISKYFSHSNNIHIKKYERKIVIKLRLSKLLITH